MRLSLREESMHDVVTLEKDICDNLKISINNFLDKINILKERTQYMPIGELNNILSQFIQEVANNSMLLAYEEWENSDNSFVKIASKFRVGELAEEEARKYEKNIETIIQDSFLDIHISELLGLSNTDISSKDLEEIKLYSKDLYKELEELAINTKVQIENLRNENVIADGLLPLAEYQFTSFQVVAEIVSNITDTLIDHFVQLLEENKKMLENAAEESLRNARKTDNGAQPKSSYDSGINTSNASSGQSNMSPINDSSIEAQNSGSESNIEDKTEDSTDNQTVNEESVGKMVEGLKELETILSDVEDTKTDSEGNNKAKKQKFVQKIKNWIDNNPEAVKFLNSAGKAALKMIGTLVLAKYGGLASILMNLTNFLGDLNPANDNKLIGVIRDILNGLDFEKITQIIENEDQSKSEDNKPILQKVVEELVDDFGKELIRNINDDIFNIPDDISDIGDGDKTPSKHGQYQNKTNNEDSQQHTKDTFDKDGFGNSLGYNSVHDNAPNNINSNINNNMNNNINSNNIPSNNNNDNNNIADNSNIPYNSKNMNAEPNIHPMYRNTKLSSNDFANGVPNKYVSEVDDYKPAFDSRELTQATSKAFQRLDSNQVDTPLNLFSIDDMDYLKSEIQEIKLLLNSQKEGSVLPQDSNFSRLLETAGEYANNTIRDLEGNTVRDARKNFSKPLNKEDMRFLNNVIDDMDLDDISNGSLEDVLKHMTKNIVRKEYGYPYEDKNNQAIITKPEELVSAVKGNQEMIFVSSELRDQVYSVMNLKKASNFVINILFAMVLVIIPAGIALTPFSGGLAIPVTTSVMVASVVKLTKIAKEDILNILAMAATNGKALISLMFKGYSIVKDSAEGLLLRKI